MSAKTELRPEVHAVRVVRAADDDPDLSYLEQSYEDDSIPPAEAAKYREQDAERLKDYGNGWAMLGIYAEADVRFRTPQGGWTQGAKVRTPGIWGVESDSDEDYFAELGENELDELRDMLLALNVPEAEIRRGRDECAEIDR